MQYPSGGNAGEAASLPVTNSARTPALAGFNELAVARPQANAGGFDAHEIWRVLQKWWWLITSLAIAGLIAGVIVSLLIAPAYRARSIIEVNPESGREMKVGQSESVQVNSREFLQTQAGLLESRALAERVSRALNLGSNEVVVDQDLPASQRTAEAADILQDTVSITPARDSRLITIAAESNDPVLAARIANGFAENFIQLGMERNYEATAYARRFLEQRLASTKARLEMTERQLVAYAKQQGIISLSASPKDGGNAGEQSVEAASLTALNNALAEARAQRITAEQRYRQSAGNRSTTEVVQNPAVQALTTERAKLQAEYAQKSGIYQPDYPEMQQLQARIRALDRSIGQTSGGISGAVRSEYLAAVGRERALQGRVDGLKQALLNLRERSIQYNILQREVDTNRSLYDALLQRYKEVGAAGGSIGANAVSIADRAQVPTAPFRPDFPLNIIVSLILGLIVGIAAAFGLEWVDDTIKTPEDLKTKLGLAPLGVIPMITDEVDVREKLEDLRSPVSEAYQSVRAALQFSTDHGIPRSLLVTSTRAAEGKSSTSLALANTIAALGRTVLLIDSDLRKPTFRGPSSSNAGLSNLLAGSADLRKSIHPTTIEGIYLLPAGAIPPNPAELLATGRMAEILQEASGLFDNIIVDGPPILGLADAPMLSSVCEGVVMVIESGGVRRAAAFNSISRLRAADAHILGGVLTKFHAKKSGYGYGYGYGYGEDAYAYEEGETAKKQIELVKAA